MPRDRSITVTQGAGTRNRGLAHTQDKAGSIPAPATTPSAEVVSTDTGEIQDALSFMAQLRDLDASIARADHTIGTLKEDLKTARRHREGLVTELRAVARGERALPFVEVDEVEQKNGPERGEDAAGPELKGRLR